jgi:AraC-like DNA-binding protein
MDNSEYIKSLDDVLTAHKYALSSNDHYYIFKSKYYIAQNKIYLGQIKDANNILKECVTFFKKNTKIKEYGKDYIQMYIFSMMNYIDTNSKLNKQKENLSLIKEAINFCDKNKLEHYIPYFLSSEGSDAYYLKNYSLAINKLRKAQHLYQDNWPHYTEIFYIGMSYWKLGNKKEAVKYFKKLDKEYYKDKNQDPQYRPAYELLIEYYASKNNTDKQLEYINKLMSLDKSYEKNYKYLFAKIHKEYDTKKLIDEKNSIETNLKVHQYLTLIIIILSILIISFSTYKYFQMQRRYKERFEQIISQNTEVEKIPVTIVEESRKITPKIAGLSESTITFILEQLEIFEKKQQFLDSKITQKLLSEKFGTNPTYLSKIINVYKEKNFSNYLNDLRLEYIVELLKTEHKYLNRDIKELANIAGFTNAEAFSDNFQRKFEIKPSYFIKMMKENIKTSSL